MAMHMRGYKIIYTLYLYNNTKRRIYHMSNRNTRRLAKNIIYTRILYIFASIGQFQQ